MAPAIQTRTSPNFGTEEIPVEFLVLHYTACPLEAALEILCSPERKVCAHFVLGLDGTIHDLGGPGKGFWNGPIRQGAHAGKSEYLLDGKKWEAFNRFSIGIEIVNLNGNLLPYTPEQYESLALMGRHLMARFPQLRDPARVLGHEQIAGFRGKVDPGTRFDWKRFYSSVYGEAVGAWPERSSVLDDATWARFEARHGKVDPARMDPAAWSTLSSRLEAFVDELKGPATSCKP